MSKVTPLLIIIAVSLPVAASAGRVKLQYDVRVRGARIGTASVDFGRFRRKSGKRLRPVTFQADLKPLGLSVIRIKGTARSWVKTDYTPVEAVWDWQELGGPSEVKATWKRGRLNGKYSRNGHLRKQIVKQIAGNTSDVVSVFGWLMTQNYAEGRVLKTTTYTGNQLYRVTAKVGAVERVVLPDGAREAWPVTFKAVRPGKTRDFKVWIDARSKVPVKLQFEYKLLGAVDAVLTRTRRKK